MLADRTTPPGERPYAVGVWTVKDGPGLGDSARARPAVTAFPDEVTARPFGRLDTYGSITGEVESPCRTAPTGRSASISSTITRSSARDSQGPWPTHPTSSWSGRPTPQPRRSRAHRSLRPT